MQRGCWNDSRIARAKDPKTIRLKENGMHYAIRRFFIVALLTSPGYSLSPIVITNLPDTFSCASERTPVKILSLDTALHFKGLFTLSCPGTGSQDFALEKQPSAITTPLISSLHPCECLRLPAQPFRSMPPESNM
jgi:hypothetical protein